MSSSVRAVLFDVDGTLVDSNDAHANAWTRAFLEHGVEVDPAHVRRCIGMGGDKLMPAVSGLEINSPQGKLISTHRGEIFTAEFLPTLTPFRSAHALVAAVKDRGLTAVAASSAQQDELRALLEVAGVTWLMDAATSSDDAEESKPAPDIIEAALKAAKVMPHEALLIGDTPYDIEAARRAGVRTIALRSGGWGDQDLTGATQVYDGTWDLLAHLAESAVLR